ncbi:hypothetical protein MMC14_010234 [Varicellaria rhodocarpa]|nr:hypothetical protein [Varicellaria rhodocarpa]
MSFARLVLSTSTIEDMPRHSMKSLPPMDEAILSIHRYLNTVSVLYPVLSETVIFGSLNAVYQHQGRYARYIDHWNVRMIFAIASITQSTSKNDIQYNDALHHASSALERAEAVLQPGSAVGIQSILLLLLFALLDPFHFSSWYLIGVASRAMVDLGLHQDPAEDTKIRESDLDRRHRIYQCVYMLDRLVPFIPSSKSVLIRDRAISITNLRAFSFSDDSANVTLPMDKIYSYTPSINSTTPKHLSQSLEPNVLLLQIRQTQSKWYQALFQSDPKALVEPWQSRCDGINDILNCSLDVSNVKLPPLQQLFQSELLYSNILFIWPPKSLATVCPYGRALVFHNAIEYARTVWMMCTSPNTNLLNSLCLARSLFVGQRLLAVLRASSDPLASLISLQDPHIPPCRSILPKIVKTELAYKLEDAIRGIQWINEVLEALSGRFGDSPNSEEFQRESISVLQPLLSYHSQRVVQIPETIPRALQSMSHIGQTTLPSTPSWDPIRDGIHYVSR